MRVLFSNDHKSVGLRFLWLALFSVVLGMTLSLAMRLQLSQAGGVYANASEEVVSEEFRMGCGHRATQLNYQEHPCAAVAELADAPA